MAIQVDDDAFDDGLHVVLAKFRQKESLRRAADRSALDLISVGNGLGYRWEGVCRLRGPDKCPVSIWAQLLTRQDAAAFPLKLDRHAFGTGSGAIGNQPQIPERCAAPVSKRLPIGVRNRIQKISELFHRIDFSQ